MWNKDQAPAIRAGSIGRIEPVDILYYYDGPLLFTAKAGIFDALFYKMDESEDSDFFLVVPTNKKIIRYLKEISISILCALRSKDYWILEAKFDGTVASAWHVDRSELAPMHLPKSGIGIAPTPIPLPDTLEQREAYFAVKFSGAGLTEEGLSLKTLKILVDKVHSASTRLLTPLGLGNLSTSDIFEFPVAQPQLSSLVISLQEPKIDQALLDERRRKHNLRNFDIYEATDHRREEFFETVNEFLDGARRGHMNEALAADRFSYLEVFSDLVPATDSGVDRTEFDANDDEGRKHVWVDTALGDNIRRAYSIAATRPVRMVGKIELINGARGTFVILDDVSRKQVTCALDYELFTELDRQKLLFVGQEVAVSGDLTRRTRRDYLNVVGRPVFTEN